MKTFKIVDIWIQAIVWTVCLILIMNNIDSPSPINYFVLIGTQAISIIIHELKHWFTNKGSNRYNYHRTLLVIVVFAILAPAIPLFLPMLLVLFFATPFMAGLYISVSFKELQVIKAKELIHLR